MDDVGGLLNWPALQAWLARSPAPGNGPVVAVRELTGGTQNHLFQLTREDGTAMVLRRPPRHPRPNSDKTMLREARVLAALSGSDVPHPAFHAVCDDPSVIGTCFHLGEVVDGFNPGSGLEGQYDDPRWQHEFGLSMVDSIAALAVVVAGVVVAAAEAHRRRARCWLGCGEPTWRWLSGEEDADLASGSSW